MDRAIDTALVSVAALAAALAWYGPGLIGLAPVALVCWALARSRWAAFAIAIGYYTVAYACLPGTLDGFFHGGGVAFAYGAIAVLAAVLAGLWATLWGLALSWWRAPALLALLILPPFGLAHLWSPLFGLAAWFPGLGLVALVVFAVALALVRKRPLVALAFAGAVAIVAHAREVPGGAPSGWVGRDTAITTAGYGQPPAAGDNDLRQLATVEAMIADAQAGTAHVVVYPELHLGSVADPSLGFFASQWARLAAQGKTVVTGLAVVADGTNANGLAGYGASPFFWRQRIPALGAMWRPWDPTLNYPMRFGGSQVAHVGGLRTTIAICFEAGLMWPLLASQLAQPEAYIAVGNLSWGRTTNLNRQGRAAAAAWARLAGLPAVIAINN